jgi:hypothetical protein
MKQSNQIKDLSVCCGCDLPKNGGMISPIYLTLAQILNPAVGQNDAANHKLESAGVAEFR